MKSGLKYVLTTGLCVSALVAPSAYGQATGTSDVRVSSRLGSAWHFHQGDVPPQGTAPDFDDSAWDKVELPHSWNRVGFYRPDPGKHINRANNISKFQGPGWYRLTFRPDTAMSGKRAWLEFDAASRIASVWLNGKKLGDHAGGFSRFRFDATDALIAGKDNVLAVRVDNSPVTDKESPTADVLPLTGDFFVHGGLYRPARLLITDPLHLDLADYGGPGFSATTTSLTAQGAQVAISARITNDDKRSTPAQFIATLIDRDGKVAATARRSLTATAGKTGEVALTLDVATPHAWQGVQDPYLYTLRIQVADAKGRITDQLSQNFGLRMIHIDPAQGLFLNGRHVAMHGAAYHQDREGKGWATTPEDVETDVKIMREMGVNTIRLSHYQHGQAIHDLADRYGLLLWDEIPLVSAWTRRGELEPCPALLDNARQQLRELIRQNRNHPSVISWGIGNEVDFGNSFPAFLTGNTSGKTPDPMPVLHMLNDLAHVEDPSRPTALATCCEGRLFAAGVDIPTTAEAADLGGANRYFGWYFGAPDDLGPQLDALHAKRPRQPLSVTEYGAGGATTIHTDNVLGGPIDSRGRNQPEEYQSFIHEKAWKAMSARPYLWATWIWNGFDFATTIRAEGDAQDINTKGLVTYDRSIRKDAWYFYKANWTTTPTVHINSSRYVDRAYRVTDVRVYSNAPTTELTLNGRVIGKQANCPDGICEWKDVVLAPGRNTLEASGTFGDSRVSDGTTWNLSPDAAANTRIDAGAIVAGAPGFGSDTWFTGGQARTLDKPGDYGKPAAPALIGNTDKVAVATTYREGRFAYHIPLPRGRYEVRLTFVEPEKAAGERVFDVVANGQTLVKNLDVAKATGGPSVALQKTAMVNIANESLDLTFTATKGEAIVSAIEILRES